MLKLDSSNIDSVNYSSEMELLTVVFNSGAVYHYFNVDAESVCNFLFADSHGKAFNKYIKPHFDYERI